MAVTPYNLRGKLNAQGVSIKTTPTVSPFARQTPRSPQKSNGLTASLDLRTVIGTTTESQPGFACHPDSGAFAFCAGSTVVLARLDETGQISQHFLRAQPFASACNPVFSFYDENTTGGTPDRRRRPPLSIRSAGFSIASTGSPRREWNEESSSKPWTAKDKVKATTSISLSTDGRFLAVGETGYCPRVLIFATENDSMVEVPLSIITDHSFGVRAVAFSPDSHFLATLGDPNDGFLFVWTFDAKTGAVKLHSTNKCTANIYDMAWCGNSLITVGTRHVKIWRVPERPRASPAKPRGRRLRSESLASPSPQALLGRNCLLGSLADATFTCVTAISSNEAVVCTDQGHVCLIGGPDNAQEIKVSRRLSFGIYAVTTKPSTGKVLFAGVDRRLESEDCETIRCLARPARWPSSAHQSPASHTTSLNPLSPYGSHCRIARPRRHFIAALGWLAKHVVSVDSDFKITVLAENNDKEFASTKTLQSHQGPVQGLNILPGNSSLGSFFTWSPSGKLNFWDGEGRLQHSTAVEVENAHDEDEGVTNELKVVQAFENADFFVCGDRLGVVKVIKADDWSVLHELRAHGTEITGIAVHEASQTTLIATCGRDRLVQLVALTRALPKDKSLSDPTYSSSETMPTNHGLRSKAGFVELLQTMDDHVGAVSHVLFTNQGERLLSCSADRTVIVRERVMRDLRKATSIAYISSRIITLKSSPISMCTVPGDQDNLVVSTMDRQVLRLNTCSGTLTESFKVTDGDGDESAVMNSIQVSKGGSSSHPRLLVGSCSIEKSIRVYDYDQCVLLKRESGHTEGISGLLLIEEDLGPGEMKGTVISTGLDGTIMIWDLSIRPPPTPSTPLQELSQGQALQICDSNGTPSRAPIALRPPLRKVLSKTNLADFSFFDPITKSLTPVRDQSPPRIRKKSSRYSLAPNKLGLTDSPSLPPLKRSTTGDDRKGQVDPVRYRSPSPQPIPLPPTSQGPKQRSPTTPAQRSAQTYRRGQLTRSPSPPPPPMPNSMPSTPSSKTAQSANNARLRRPPSVPSNLNSHASNQTRTPRGRRKSLNPSATPATTTTPTTDQTAASATQNLSRSLRGYRKKIRAAAAEQAKEQLQLEEVETELLATLQSVREAKKANAKARLGSGGGGSGCRGKAKPATESDLDELVKLVERSGV